MFLDTASAWATASMPSAAATCVPVQRARRKEMVEWVDKPGAEEAVASCCQDITIRHKFEDCIDIPPTFKHVVKFYPTKKQRGAYESMERDAIALMNKGMVSAVNAAAVRTKMLQIASGAVYENDHKYHLIDTSRYELVMDLVEERKHSIVFYLWKHQRDEIVRMAQAAQSHLLRLRWRSLRQAAPADEATVPGGLLPGHVRASEVGRPRAHADQGPGRDLAEPARRPGMVGAGQSPPCTCRPAVRDRDHRDPRAEAPSSPLCIASSKTRKRG
jgi:hypothetical protein